MRHKKDGAGDRTNVFYRREQGLSFAAVQMKGTDVRYQSQWHKNSSPKACPSPTVIPHAHEKLAAKSHQKSLY